MRKKKITNRRREKRRGEIFLNEQIQVAAKDMLLYRYISDEVLVLVYVNEIMSSCTNK